MADQPKQSNPFVRNFIPGLVIGLICGGLAGAILPPILERWGRVPDTLGSGSAHSRTAGPRDAIPGSGTPATTPTDEPAPSDPAPPATPGEPRPEEVKPADPATTPAPK